MPSALGSPTQKKGSGGLVFKNRAACLLVMMVPEARMRKHSSKTKIGRSSTKEDVDNGQRRVVGHDGRH